MRIASLNAYRISSYLENLYGQKVSLCIRKVPGGAKITISASSEQAKEKKGVREGRHICTSSMLLFPGFQRTKFEWERNR